MYKREKRNTTKQMLVRNVQNKSIIFFLVSLSSKHKCRRRNCAPIIVSLFFFLSFCFASHFLHLFLLFFLIEKYNSAPDVHISNGNEVIHGGKSTSRL